MARIPIYHESKVCNRCYSTVVLFGPLRKEEDDRVWRCTNPLCEKFKDRGIIVDEDLIERSRVTVEILD